MAKTYKVTPANRFVNRMMRWMIQWGIAPPRTYLLKVAGRRTGKEYSTPVTLVEKEGQRWLVSPYGEVNWVRNARASGEVTLTLRREIETFKIRELDPQDAAPILKEYITLEGFVLPYFDVTPESKMGEFIAEAPAHPVFILEENEK